MRWKPGDRVIRQTVFDNGIWANRGDSCIETSPIRRGVIISRSTKRNDEVLVRFDDGEEKLYLDHGLDKEKGGGHLLTRKPTIER